MAKENRLDGLSLRDIISAIWRHKMIIALTVVLITTLAAIILSFVENQYKATALVIIENRGTNIVKLQSVVEGLSRDSETIEGEMVILQSRDLVKKVINKLALDKDEEFVKPGDADTPSIIVDRFLKHLQVSQQGRSRVIAVSFSSSDAKKAAQIANKLTDLYIDAQLEDKFRATNRATAWLNKRVTELQEKVRLAETEVEKFRQESGLIQSKESTITSQQLSELNSQWVLAKIKRAETQAHLEQVQKLVQSGGVDSASEVLDSELIQKLRAQEVEIQRKLAESSTEYGAKHPKMINLRADLQEFQAKISSEVNKIIKGLENRVAIAKARESSLNRSLNRLKRRVGKSNEESVHLRALTREAEANRLVLQTYLTRLKETSSQSDKDVQRADARIVSYADVPSKPYFPKTIPILALVIIGASLIGIVIGFLQDHLARGFHSGEQIEALTGIPALGFVPWTNMFENKKNALAVLFKRRTKTAFFESINTLRWSLSLSNNNVMPKIIAITSSLSNEGKTTIAVSLASMESLNGKKVLIIDGDYRLPGVHEAFNLKAGPGLQEWLTGKAALRDIINKELETGVYVLKAGQSTINFSPVLFDKMNQLLEQMSKEFDLIVLDLPPVMATKDAVVLSTLADTTIFSVRWAYAKRANVQHSIEQFKKTNVQLAGVLLTMVNVGKHSQFGFGDSGYYHGDLNKYYAA